MTNQKTLYTYSVEGDEYADYEFATQKEADTHAQNDFFQQCDDEGVKGTESRDIEIIAFHWDDNGERVITDRIETCVEFEYYHGDFAEHNTY